MKDCNEQHRSTTRNGSEPHAIGGADSKEFPSMRALRVSSLPAAGFGFTVFSSFSFLQAVFALVGPVHLRVRARCARHHLLSVSAFLPSTRCCMRPKRARRTGFRTRRPLYQDGRAHGTAQEIHGRLDQPSTLQAPVVDCLVGSDPGGDEPRPLGHHAILEVTPQRDQ